MLLQLLGYSLKLIIAFGHILLKFIDIPGCTYSGYHIFALSVDQKFSIQFFVAIRRIAGKADTRGTVTTHIAINHHLHVDRRTRHSRNSVDFAVGLCPRCIPGPQHSIYCMMQLLAGILRKIIACIFLIDSFKQVNKFFQFFNTELGIKLYLLLILFFLEDFFKILSFNAHNHVAEHIDKAAVAIVGKTFIVRFFG